MSYHLLLGCHGQGVKEEQAGEEGVHQGAGAVLAADQLLGQL